jgi:hypothetical protein
MANLRALKEFILGLKGDQLFNTGIVGSTSQLQQQVIELRKSFAALQANSNSIEIPNCINLASKNEKFCRTCNKI